MRPGSHHRMTLLAEISDKMPSVGQMYLVMSLVGLFLAALAFGLSMVSRWVGLAFVILVGLAGGFLAGSGGTMNAQVVRELGRGYLYHEWLSCWVPFLCCLAAWAIARFGFKPPTKG